MGENQNTGKGSDKRKQSLYFPESMLQEIKDEAARLDRSLSWIVQRAWPPPSAGARYACTIHPAVRATCSS